MKLFLLTIVLAMLGSTYGKIFSKCELARILANSGFPRAQIPDWICIAQNESQFNTKATNKNTNGSTDYGMFQINNKFWCDSSYGGNDCKMSCSSLLDDNITDDLACVKIIFNRHKFNAWVAWTNKCNGKALPSVAECF